MKKIFLLLMVCIFLTVPSFAQTFSDTAGHWAEGTIEAMVKEGIISGYTDGTFKPDAELSKIHSLLLLAKAGKITNNASAASKFATQYASTLSKYSTPYKTEIAYLLGTGVLNENDLDSLIADNVINNGLTREEMATLITKILGKEKEATSKSLIILSFTDSGDISAKAKPYVYFVSSNGYMNGMTSNTFGPKIILTRAQATSILQRIYKLIDLKVTDTVTPSTQASSFLSGTITSFDTKSVTIKDSNGKSATYSYDSKTEFYVNSKVKTSTAMKKNAAVTITYTNDKYITIMNITDGANVETSTISGTISSFNTTKKTITVKKSSKTYTYNFDSDTKFTLDGKTSTYSKALKNNYDITITVDDNYVSTAKITKPVESIIGKIIEVDSKIGYVIVEGEDDVYLLIDEYLDEYEDGDEDEDFDEDVYFDDDTTFTYNGSSLKYSKLSTSNLYKKGYYVEMILDGSSIEELRIGSSKSNLKSSDSSKSDEIIGKIIMADDDCGYVIVTDDEDDDYLIVDDDIYDDDAEDEDYEEEYYFDEDTEIIYNGTSLKYSKLSTSNLYKKSYYIRITLDDDYIEKLEISSTESRFTSSSSSSNISDGYVRGYVVEIDDDLLVIEDDDGEEYEFNIGSNCIVLEYDSTDPEDDLEYYEDYYEDIDEDDEVLVLTYKKSSKYYTSLVILLD